MLLFKLPYKKHPNETTKLNNTSGRRLVDSVSYDDLKENKNHLGKFHATGKVPARSGSRATSKQITRAKRIEQFMRRGSTLMKMK